MKDNTETLLFLKDCIKTWEDELKHNSYTNRYDRDSVEKMIRRAKKLVKQHKLLYQYDINIKTPMRITGDMMRAMIKNLTHYLTGYEAHINMVESLVDNNRNLPKAPESCSGCKWLRNDECWYENQYHESFPVDCAGYEKEK